MSVPRTERTDRNQRQYSPSESALAAFLDVQHFRLPRFSKLTMNLANAVSISFAVLLLSTLLLYCGPAFGQEKKESKEQKQGNGKQQAPVPQDEYENKAIQMVKFTKYTKWPSNFGNLNPNEFVIGILGDDPFGKYMAAFEGQPLQKTGQKIVVKRFNTVEEFETCHMLFISRDPAPNAPNQTPEERLRLVLEKAKDTRPLIVSDTAGMKQKGAMINFFFLVENGVTKVKFEINQQAVRDAKIEIEAQMMQVAKVPKN